MSDLGSTGDRGGSPREGDALAVLGWGLRHYFWIIVLCVCTLGILSPILVERTPATFEAEAQVGPDAALNLQNLDPLPRLGESLFRNGRVAESVRQSYDPPLSPTEEVIPQRVRLVTAQDNVVLTVVGTAPDAEEAAGLANAAAETLADELTRYESAVGAFAVQRSATPPGAPVPRMGRTSAAGLGGLAGLVAGLGIVGLLLVRRRPVLSAEGAEAATGALVLGQVWLGRTSAESRGLPQLCHTIEAFGCEELLLVGSRRTRTRRRELVTLLTEVLSGRRDVTAVNGLPRDRSGPRPKGRVSGGRAPIFLAEDASQAQVVARSDRSVAVLVVPRGISRASLARQVQQHLDGGAAGILLVRDAARRRRLLDRVRPGNRASSKDPAPGGPVGGPATTGNGSGPRTGSAEPERTGGSR